VFNDTDDTPMYQVPSRDMTQFHNTDNTQNATPIYFDFNGSTSGDPNVDLWPIPDASYVINFDMVIPQDSLSSDDDTLTVPEWPVILGAYAKAIDERGEDNGVLFTKAEDKYMKALSDAIALDAANLPFETLWEAQ
jgi:hypothetical protein